MGAANNRVLLIDTDSQGHATLLTTGRNDFGTDDSLYTVLMADRQQAAQVMANCIVQSAWDPDLHVLPASPMLEGAERELMGVAGTPYRLADPLSRIAPHYAAIVIDTRPSFSLMTEMGLIASTDALVPVEPRYLETVGLMSVVDKIANIREGWRAPHLRISGLVVTKMDTRVRGHNYLLEEAEAILSDVAAGLKLLAHPDVQMALRRNIERTYRHLEKGKSDERHLRLDWDAALVGVDRAAEPHAGVLLVRGDAA
jgi:cellulose biosynthesis protein BcsQ